MSADESRQKDILLMVVAVQFAVVGWLPLLVVSVGITAGVLLNEATRRLDEYSGGD